ncbi:MAG: mRNA cap guanine-N7 methyltransferase [Chrysothrix sp. TS-e1954]|nr:MAG: mRNA cap guanine-N7 methyltransferase [Chrysothrix sp. TS-e1954]
MYDTARDTYTEAAGPPANTDMASQDNGMSKKRILSGSMQASASKSVKITKENNEANSPDAALANDASDELKTTSSTQQANEAPSTNVSFASLKRHLKPESERAQPKPKSTLKRRETSVEKRKRETAAAEALPKVRINLTPKQRALNRRSEFRAKSSSSSSNGSPKKCPASLWNYSPRGRAPQRKASMSQASTPAPIARTPSRSPPRKLKRPGAGAAVSTATREAALKKQQERDEIAKADIARRGVGHVTTQHYNEAMIMTKEQRQETSKIIGLRNFNNWAKSAVIQKFSADEGFVGRPNASIPGEAGKRLLVLDIGSGKAGDLQKWEKAPQALSLYVGLDPAENLIEEAKRRYKSRQASNRRIFDGRFIVKDCFAGWLGDVPIVNEVGIDGSVGPDGNPQAQRFGGGGFDVVSMMFCIHYAFETEDLARGMLRNVAGSLKKGGRFIGVNVNSDAIAAKVVEHYGGEKQETAAGLKSPKQDGLNYDDEAADDWNPEKPADAVSNDSSDSDWDPEAPAESKPIASVEFKKPEPAAVDDSIPHPSWGNSLYSFNFLSKPPTDGLFRPPFGWKYDYKLEEAVATPEFVVPFEALRALALDYDLELQWRKPFMEIWESEKNDPVLGELSRRMKVCRELGGSLNASAEEIEASSFYHAFCFYKT